MSDAVGRPDTGHKNIPNYSFPGKPGRHTLPTILQLPALVAVMCGAQYTYVVFDWVWGAVGVLAVLRVGPRYWGAAS